MGSHALYELDGHVATIRLTNDAAEGVAAFRERRPPIWTGT